MPRAITTDEMLEIIREWAAVHHASKLPKRFRLYFVGDDPEDFVALPIPAGRHAAPSAAAPVTEPDDDDPESANLRDRVLELLSEVGEPLKSSAIARRLGRKYNGHFRRVIKLMRDSNDITTDSDGSYILASE